MKPPKPKPKSKSGTLAPMRPDAPGLRVSPDEGALVEQWKPAVSEYISGGLNIERSPMEEIAYNSRTMVGEYGAARMRRHGPIIDGVQYPIPNERMFPDRFGINKIKKAFFERPDLVKKAFGDKQADQSSPYTRAENEAERSSKFTDIKKGVIGSPTPEGSTPDTVFDTISAELQKIFGYTPAQISAKRMGIEDVLAQQAPERGTAGLPDPNSLGGAFAIGQALAALLRGDGIGSAAEAYAAPMQFEQQRLDEQYALGTARHRETIDLALKQLGIVADTQQEMSRYAQNYADNVSRETIANDRIRAAAKAQEAREAGLDRRSAATLRRKDVSELMDALARTVDPDQRAAVIANINGVYGSQLIDPRLAYVQDPALIKSQYDAVTAKIRAENEAENQRLGQEVQKAKALLAKIQARYTEDRRKLMPAEMALRQKRLEQMDKMLTLNWQKFQSEQSFDYYRMIQEFMSGSSEDSMIGILEDEHSTALDRLDDARIAWDKLRGDMTADPKDIEAAKAEYDAAKKAEAEANADLKEARAKRRESLKEGGAKPFNERNPAVNPDYSGPPDPTFRGKIGG